MDLIFTPLELIAIVLAVYVTRNLIYDGESTWLEGLILVGVYLLFGIAFLHHPGTEPPNPLIAPPAAAARPKSIGLGVDRDRRAIRGLSDGKLMLSWSEFAVGLLIWVGVLWDGFATVVLPRTVAPMRRLSGRFTRWSWRLWAAVGRRIRQPELRLSFLAVYGPLSVMLLLVLWAGLMIVAFALIYHGLGPRFQAAAGPVGFGTLLYMSGSTFLTLGLGDVTSAGPARPAVHDPRGRDRLHLPGADHHLHARAGPGLRRREVGNLLIHSRAGRPPGAIQLLRRYSGADHSEILRGNLREAERWMAEILQSHLSHPVLSFYRAQHLGQSWLVSLTTVLDSCAC